MNNLSSLRKSAKISENQRKMNMFEIIKNKREYTMQETNPEDIIESLKKIPIKDKKKAADVLKICFMVLKMDTAEELLEVACRKLGEITLLHLQCMKEDLKPIIKDGVQHIVDVINTYSQNTKLTYSAMAALANIIKIYDKEFCNSLDLVSIIKMINEKIMMKSRLLEQHAELVQAACYVLCNISAKCVETGVERGSVLVDANPRHGLGSEMIIKIIGVKRIMFMCKNIHTFVHRSIQRIDAGEKKENFHSNTFTSNEFLQCSLKNMRELLIYLEKIYLNRQIEEFDTFDKPDGKGVQSMDAGEKKKNFKSALSSLSSLSVLLANLALSETCVGDVACDSGVCYIIQEALTNDGSQDHCSLFRDALSAMNTFRKERIYTGFFGDDCAGGEKHEGDGEYESDKKDNCLHPL